MTPIQAEKIIQEYGGVLGQGSEELARNKSLLPCSLPRIKYAFFIYIEELIKVDKFSKDIHNNLSQIYSALGTFIDDDEAEFINTHMQELKDRTLSEEDTERVKKFILKSYGNMELLIEFGEYVDELLP